MIKSLKSNIKKVDYFLIIYLSTYFCVSILFLTKFPTMHSDESWLSGLTRSMMQEGLGTTEYFFDLIPRYPHAIKSIFHILQMSFILVFGYSLFSVRLLSLAFGMISLVLFYKIIKQVTKSERLALIGMLILSLDIQFIYASHFARQEIMLVFFLLVIICYIISHKNNWSIKNDIITGIIIGVSAGIHPNSFLIALVAGSIYLYYILFEKKLKLKNLLLLILTTGLISSVFIGLSFIFNNDFIHDYLKYGDDLGATSNIIMKFFAFPGYYRRLYNSFSGTYYVPNIKFQFILFALSLLLGILSLFSGKEKRRALLFIIPILLLNIGYMIIGRYSQPGIILLFPLCYLLIFLLLDKLKKYAFLVAICLGIIIATSTLLTIFPQVNNDYKEYINQIKNVVPEDAQVLANLNTEYAFEYNALHDYRNLNYLGEMSFEQYIKEREIKYIIYPEEMDFIYNTRPVWNIMYGNLYPYYEDMKRYLSENCVIVSQFSSPYAMRILMYSAEKEWTVTIYEVVENDK